MAELTEERIREIAARMIIVKAEIAARMIIVKAEEEGYLGISETLDNYLTGPEIGKLAWQSDCETVCKRISDAMRSATVSVSWEDHEHEAIAVPE